MKIKQMQKFLQKFLVIGFYLGVGQVFLGSHILSANEKIEKKTNQEVVEAEVEDRGESQLLHRKWDFSHFEKTAIQAGGRVKPLDSFAREVTLSITGSRTFAGFQPVELLLSWLTFPQFWDDKVFIQISRLDVRRQLGLDEKRTRFTPKELFQSDTLRQYAGNTGQVSKNNEVTAVSKADPRETELKRVFERMNLYRAIVSGDAWTVFDIKEKEVPWLSLASMMMPENQERLQQNEVKSAFVSTVKSFQAGDEMQFKLYSEILEKKSSQYPNLSMEVFYNHLRPNLIAWILYLVGSLVILLVGFFNLSHKGYKVAGFSMVSAGFLIHIVGMTLRSLVAGRPPVSNMYESIVWVSFGCMFFSLLLFWRQRSWTLLTAGGVASAITLIVADAAPTLMDPGIHPLVPVLRSNYWLTIHVLTITLGYAAFLLTLGMGNVTLFHYFKGKTGWLKTVSNLNHLTYRAMQFGVVLLAAGTILGGVWADYSWGRFWGWDPKETWALIALLAYLAILHARYTGWMGQFGYAAFSVIAFLTVVMAWYGVNFILGAGLHSYGFSSGGLGFVTLFTVLQLGYVGAVYLKVKKKKQV